MIVMQSAKDDNGSKELVGLRNRK